MKTEMLETGDHTELLAELQNYKHKCKSLEGQNSALKLKLDVVNQDLERYFSEGARAHKLFTDCTKLRTELLSTRNEKSVLEKQVTTLTVALRRAEKRITDKDEELVHLKNQLTAAKDTAAKHKATWRDLEEKLKKVLGQRDGFRSEWLKCSTQISDMEEKNSVQAAALNAKDKEIREQSKEIHQLKEELDIWRINYGYMDKEKHKLRGQIQKLNSDLVYQNDKMVDLRRHHSVENKMRSRITVVEVSAPRPVVPQEQNPKVRALEKELHIQKAEVSKLQNVLTELRNSMAQVNTKYNKCRIALREKEKEVKALTQDIDIYRKWAEELKEKVTKSRIQTAAKSQQKTVINVTEKVLRPESPIIHKTKAEKSLPTAQLKVTGIRWL